MQTSAMTSDPIQDMGRYEKNPLRAIFEPKTVAVIGASEKVGSVGRTVLWNLITNPFGGTVYPVNPKRANVLGIRAYPDIKSIPEPVDLAVLATPAPIIPGLIGDCVEAGVNGAIIISAGFKEMGAPGIELERQIMEHARRGGMRIIGPNCLGVMNPLNGLNATFAAGIARPGNVAFISQSGALCTAVLDWSLSAKVGFSAFVSIGSMVDVGWGDLIDYLGNDPRTNSIVIYMESIGDARTSCRPPAKSASPSRSSSSRPAARPPPPRPPPATRAASRAATRSWTQPSSAAASCASIRSSTCSRWPTCSASSRARAARA